jgi:hypothetical protein
VTQPEAVPVCERTIESTLVVGGSSWVEATSLRFGYRCGDIEEIADL